jgi:hypothetical protein
LIKYRDDLKAGQTQIYYRLIALWGICEAMIGGIIHGLNLPVSGLVVGSCAVICITLIGFYHPHRGAIVKATLIVAIFKMMLSPHSPFPAYLAVFFQGITGELIFRIPLRHSARCVIFASIALLESGIQRILVMTIIFGKDLWIAVDAFINGLTGQQERTAYSVYIALGYVFMHIIAGVIIGLFAAKIPEMIRNPAIPMVNITVTDEDTASGKKKKKTRIGLMITWVVVSVLILYAYSAQNETSQAVRVLLRGLFIILIWVLLIQPLLTIWIKRWLQKKQSAFKNELGAITTLLPFMKSLLVESWRLSSDRRGIRRLSYFSKVVLANSLRDA